MLPLGAILKKLALGLSLIVVSAAILLYSDLGSRAGSKANASRQKRVAIVEQVSTPPLDDGMAGALQALKERGYVDGGRMVLSRYNAQGDIATANAIAKSVTSGDFDLIISASTISLQTIANANRFATPPRHHVFGIVTDPYSIGVGVDPKNHAIHRPYMTGVGSMPPVEDTFRLALQMNPGLKRVGLVWDPAEANSVVSTKLGRAVCASLGLTLVEANAENATMVGQATASVLARGIDAIWVSPDLTTQKAINVIVSQAKVARIPVFTSMPNDTTIGSLFDLGADYRAIGHVEGDVAADVLDGRDPARIPVDNVMPITLHVDRTALKGLRDHWVMPDAIVQKADVVVDGTGRHAKSAGPAAADAATKVTANAAGANPK